MKSKNNNNKSNVKSQRRFSDYQGETINIPDQPDEVILRAISPSITDLDIEHLIQRIKKDYSQFAYTTAGYELTTTVGHELIKIQNDILNDVSRKIYFLEDQRRHWLYIKFSIENKPRLKKLLNHKSYGVISETEKIIKWIDEKIGELKQHEKQSTKKRNSKKQQTLSEIWNGDISTMNKVLNTLVEDGYLSKVGAGQYIIANKNYRKFAVFAYTLYIRKWVTEHWSNTARIFFNEFAPMEYTMSRAKPFQQSETEKYIKTHIGAFPLRLIPQNTALK